MVNEELIQISTDMKKQKAAVSLFYAEIIPLLIAKKHSKKQINQLKVKLCGKYHLKKIPTDIDIMMHASESDLKKIKKTLLTKPIRCMSGVAPIAVMSAPAACPHGKCTFCPGGPGSEFGDVPQSYTGNEPSTMRAIRAGFESYIIVFNRLEQYVVSGHVPQKAEVIIQGGTFPATLLAYQKEFVCDIYQALNDFASMFFKHSEPKVRNALETKQKFQMQANVGNQTVVIHVEKIKEFFELHQDIRAEGRQARINKKILAVKNKRRTTLEKEQKRNETSAIRCVGLTIETKPDWGFGFHGNALLELGVTRIELGVQSVYEEPLRVTHRGHTLADSIRSIRELKDLGFKVNFHYMLGLPATTKEMDVVGLRTLFDDPRYRPDMLKIYPCMVMKGTPLFHIWKAGKYQPMTTATAAEIIADFMRYIPSYCRVMRVQRDIPTHVTEAGVDKTNLRQYIDKIMQEKKIQTQEIRSREVGFLVSKHPNIVLEDPTLRVLEYDASDGKEFFISFEDLKNNALFGFLRLRFPGECLRDEMTRDSALIRELHIYGEAAAFGQLGTIQHRGLGKKLMKKAEEIAKQNRKDKMIVISAVGTRKYYKKLGYVREGVYMVKEI
ncbi:tRNA uridine(34) 5-carboxymethylaminomethyl modification radical SAM/GNAT enzyme Elp3 [Candidatus Woesearchaeota archaeon]|nr:tRNA uridine(34) 5-carboxymethylaminomethyl modification radical SAM/GNAT enzyme Elp3 [Candidatus Woesearchaeota archaeon]